MDCCLTNDDAFVVGGSEDGFVFFWELVDAPIVASFRAHSSVVSILFSKLHLMLHYFANYWLTMFPFYLNFYSSYFLMLIVPLAGH
jgi:hypothetical protein